MSNGDDVLDNWEEIDEEELTSTLAKLETKRKTQEVGVGVNSANIDATNNSSSLVNINYQAPMKLLQRASPPQTNNVKSPDIITSSLDSMAASFEPVMMVLHKTNDEYQSTNYAQPISTQTVKILRRPTQSLEPRNNGNRSRQPIKTLQQREQEYAEARLRIMGAAKNPEDDIAAAVDANNVSNTAATVTTTQAVPSAKVITTTPPKLQNVALNNCNNQFQQQHQNFYYQQQLQQTLPAINNRTAPFSPPPQSWSPIVGGSVSHSANSLMASYAAANVSSTVMHQQQQQDGILRMPRGPCPDDKTTGFQPRR